MQLRGSGQVGNSELEEQILIIKILVISLPEDVFGLFSNNKIGKKTEVQQTMHPDERWAWKIFDMEPCSEQKEIKQHYKKLAKLNHPDKNQGDTGAEERLKDINIAYSILKQLYPEAVSKLK